MIPLEPDRDQIEIFVDAVFRRASPQGFVSIRSFHEGRDEAFNITAIAFHGDRRLQFLIDNAETYAPLAVFSNRSTAREEDIEEAVALSVECDQCPRQARQKLEEVLGLATVVVGSMAARLRTSCIYIGGSPGLPAAMTCLRG
jgi:hypothetical protein